MPTLTIDNQTVTVPEGSNVLEAAKRLGIVIPHFCYHEALGAVGACRICAVKFEEGPVKGIQMSCMVEAKDGMVVSTLDPAAAELRAHVVEWLMVNHPHDCPVCDEGGECQLQDMTVAGGHGVRRFRGKKRTYNNQQLGPFIEHEMNRCIQCYRCVRTYQDYFGGDDFGVLGSRDRVYFGRFRDGKLESPFSGNLVDVCPTGVFTDKTFRFKTRYWDIEEAPSICPHCSLGCATIPGARYRELQRMRAGINPQTNGFFICDRGRFGYGHANHPERPRTPQVGGSDCAWPEAIELVRRQLQTAVAEKGADSVVFLGSPRASLEANYLLKQWAASLGCSQVVFEAHPERDRAVRTAAALLGARNAGLAEIRAADFLLLVGIDPLAEAPMLAAAVRQAVRKGAKAAVIDPRPVELACPASHLPLPPWSLGESMEALAKDNFDRLPRQQAALLEGVSQGLRHAKRPVVIGGADLLGAAGVKALASLAEALDTTERPCRAALVPAGPNSYGGALLASGPAFDSLVERMLEGKVQTLVCLENDPASGFTDPAKARLALSRVDYTLVLDSLPTRTAHKAEAFLPSRATAETAGSFVNFEGRMLAFEKVFEPGLPIRVTGGGSHPPRSFARGTPGDQPRPAWAILAELLGRPADLAAIRAEIETADPRFAGLGKLSVESEGIRVQGAGQLPPPAEAPLPHCEPGGTLRLFAVESLFGSEPLASFSAPLEAVRPAPWVLLHPEDAARFGLNEGDAARLGTERGHAEVTVRLAAAMAPGAAFVPRLFGTALESFVPGSGHLDCTLEKGGAP
ncbi:NADH-quinone oxidoreductase [Desulfuromonas versatilis]|uniref:NADH-quinone oxidoreductase n=1 Tax=Desulfuromonas versatilis TaxID=2802975 RepID=A0ABM8HMA9_9BACT|nr:NADH-quinone oxidoreductase subunit NuoG [Desulfuromonas versatilis]BCR03384.1 NADH-quinone oxidoreductase [Desulfuromonas versatilis]